MGDAVTSTTLMETPDDLILHLTNVSDGTGESAVTKVDVSALTPACRLVDIKSIQWVCDGMSAQLLWDATTPELAWTLLSGTEGTIDFRELAGFLSNTQASGWTGDLLLTTVGHTAADSYSIILLLDKRQ